MRVFFFLVVQRCANGDRRHTNKKIQQVIETEPSNPEAASRAVRGIVSCAAIWPSTCDKAMMCKRHENGCVVVETFAELRRKLRSGYDTIQFGGLLSGPG